MSKQSKWILLSASMALCSTLLFTPYSQIYSATPSPQSVTSKVSPSLALADLPSNYKSSIEWVWTNRMIKEGSTTRKNLIFDQIVAGKGTLNYVVRWQSNKSITLEQRKQVESMLSRQLNRWNSYLVGYENWPYASLNVKVVGWACANPALILNKQSNEIVYTDYITDGLSKTDSKIPAKLPVAPASLSRFEHFTDPNYAYPGGSDKRFDMYLWGTSNFGGGAGGDWGQRVSDDYILSVLTSTEAHIIEHEMGHGLGFPDFYEDQDRPPGGFPDKTIMWAGNSTTITNWDGWLLRYTWSQLKKDTVRFPIK